MIAIFRYKPGSFCPFLSSYRLGSKQFHLSSGKLVRKVTKRSSESVNQISSGKAYLSPAYESDSFNNFYGIESEEGVIHIEEGSSSSGQKYDFPYTNKTDSVEKLKNVRFGSVRLDCDNKPQFHGQFEFTDENINSLQKTQDWLKSNVNSVKTTEKLPIQSSHYNANSINKRNAETSTSKSIRDAFENNNPKDSFIDDAYFQREQVLDAPIDKPNVQTVTGISGYPPVVTQNEMGIKESYHLIKDLPLVENTQSNTQSQGMKGTNNCIEDQYFNHNSRDYSPSDTNEINPLKSEVKNQEFSFFDERYFEDLMGKDLSYKRDSSVENESFSSPSLSNISSNSFEKEVCQENQTTGILIDQVKGTKASFESSHFQAGQGSEGLIKENLVLKSDTTSNNIRLSISKGSVPKSWRESFVPEELAVQNIKNNIKTSKNIQIQLEGKTSKFGTETVKAKKELIQNSVKNEEKVPEKTSTAFDFVNKLRSESKLSRPKIKDGKILPSEPKQDNQGFRILSYQVPNLSHFTREEIMTVLKNNVLYSDDDIAVINKPYNMVMHDSQTTSDPCISQYLDELARELDRKSEDPKLITVHRLDKETCGCLLLARNEKAAQKLLTFFAQRKIVKTYWIVTINVPDPMEGVIDIPIAEGKIENRSRMVLHPNLPKDINYASHSKHGKRAVTNYRTIATSGNAALVEVQPETGIKHQIRVHFGFGLSCPVLGDHKYSHLTKMAPQKLPSDMLQHLHVRQSKVRHIPMHIYARSIIIPQYLEGRNLFVQAPMPTHMSTNLQWLKFRKK